MMLFPDVRVVIEIKKFAKVVAIGLVIPESDTENDVKLFSTIAPPEKKLFIVTKLFEDEHVPDVAILSSRARVHE